MVFIPKHPRKRSQDRRKLDNSRNSTFSPSQISKVTGWLRLASATVTGSGYSSIPDVIGTDPAVQSTDARRPVNGTSANGLPIATFTDDVLQWPLGAGNNSDTKLGVALWVKPSNTGMICCILSGAGMASANKFTVNSTATLRSDAYPEDRHAESLALTNSVWQFVTVEVDCTQSTEAAKVIHTVNGVAQSVSFASGTPWPSTMPQPTGNMLIGALTAGAVGPFRGDIGPNIFWINGQLTASERAALKNFEQPT